MDPISQSLAAWMPRLVKVWRARRKLAGPPDRLSDAEVTEIAHGIRRLSEGLTRGRRLVGQGYMDSPELLGAYLLYFWPVSYAQGRQVLGELGTRVKSALDVGSGPAPLSLAAADLGAHELYAIDRSEKALALAADVAAELRAPLTTRKWDPLAGVPLPGAGLAFTHVLVGHALNELWSEAPDRIERRAALCEELLGRVRKGGSLLLIEPALRTTTRDLLQVRDRLVSKGYAIRAPCLFQGGCPALHKEVDWCHAERAWTPPPLLARLIAAAGLHKEILQMAYLVVAPKGEAWATPPPGRLFRIVSEPLEGKKRVRRMGCGPEGRVPVSVSDANRTDAHAAYLDAARGDVLAIEHGEPAGEGEGVRLGPDTRVVRVARAGEPLSRR
jgi:SAM-dependent methyltransferase